MDLNKIGKFILELRKEKGMTQFDLGRQLNISDKSVSKWERGVNAPDISILNELADILGVTTTELLNGEKNNKEISVESIKFYNNKSKIKFVKYFGVIIILLLGIFSILFSINNYNRFKVYSISSESEDFFVNGYIIFNKERNIGFINNIDYINPLAGSTDNVLVKRLNILLMKNDVVIYSALDDLEEYLSLENSLINKTIYLDEYTNQNENILLDSLENLTIKIIYIDENDIEGSFIIPLSFVEIDSGITLNY